TLVNGKVVSTGLKVDKPDQNSVNSEEAAEEAREFDPRSLVLQQEDRSHRRPQRKERNDPEWQRDVRTQHPEPLSCDPGQRRDGSGAEDYRSEFRISAGIVSRR